MSGEQYSDIQYAIFAMERCARGMRAMGARVEAANPDDPYSAVHYYDDAESVEKAVEALKRIEPFAAPAEQPQPVAWMAVYPGSTDDGKVFVSPHQGGPYQTPLYLAPPPPAAAPITQDAILDEFCRTPGLRQHVQAFEAGVRFAERALAAAPTDAMMDAASDLLFQLRGAANYIDTLGGDSQKYRAAINAALAREGR